jgi:hypothetical protein
MNKTATLIFLGFLFGCGGGDEFSSATAINDEAGSPSVEGGKGGSGGEVSGGETSSGGNSAGVGGGTVVGGSGTGGTGTTCVPMTCDQVAMKLANANLTIGIPYDPNADNWINNPFFFKPEACGTVDDGCGNKIDCNTTGDPADPCSNVGATCGKQAFAINEGGSVQSRNFYWHKNLCGGGAFFYDTENLYKKEKHGAMNVLFTSYSLYQAETNSYLTGIKYAGLNNILTYCKELTSVEFPGIYCPKEMMKEDTYLVLK